MGVKVMIGTEEIYFGVHRQSMPRFAEKRARRDQ